MINMQQLKQNPTRPRKVSHSVIVRASTPLSRNPIVHCYSSTGLLDAELNSGSVPDARTIWYRVRYKDCDGYNTIF